MKSSSGYVVLAAILAGLIGFRYFAVSKLDSPASPGSGQKAPVYEDSGGMLTPPNQRERPESQEDAAPVVPEAPRAPQPPEPSKYPIRTEQGNLSYGSSIVARLPEKPPGQSPDPLQNEKPVRDPSWGNSAAGPDPEQVAKARPGVLEISPEEEREKRELQITRVKERVAALTAPVEKLAAEVDAGAGLKSCPSTTEFDKIPELLRVEENGAGIAAGVLRSWWEAVNVEMMCSQDLGPCLKRLKNVKDSQSEYWTCQQAGMYRTIYATLKKQEDPAACRLALSGGKGGYPALMALPEGKQKSACQYLRGMVASGDMTICVQNPSLISDEDRPAEACHEDLAWAKGPAACAKISGDDPLDKQDREDCMTNAASVAALRANNVSQCGGSKVCKALFKDPSVCGAAVGTARQRVVQEYCAASAADAKAKSHLSVQSAAVEAQDKLTKYLATLEMFSGSGKNKQTDAPHAKVVGDAIERMRAIAKERNAAATKQPAR